MKLNLKTNEKTVLDHARLYFKNCFLHLAGRCSSFEQALNQQRTHSNKTSEHLGKGWSHHRNITDKLLLKLTHISSVAIFALGDTTDMMNKYQRFTNIGKYSEGLLTAHFQSYSWNLKSLSLMSSLAVSQSISHTSADFCLSFEVCSQVGIK